MATYYWGGGSGTWSTTALTNWYTDVGRTTLATVVPGASDDVVFDSASSATAYTVTMSTAVSVRDITISAPASGAVTISTSVTLTVYGNFTAASTNVIRSGTGGTTFSPLAGTTVTVTSGAYNFYGLNFSGVDNTATINLAGAISAQAAIVYNSGNLNTNNFNITGGSFSISGTTAKTFTSGSSTITTTYGGDTRWSIVLTNLTYDLSATTIYNNSSVSFSGGGAVYGTVTFVSTSQNISGSSTYGTLNIGAGTGNIAFSDNNTIGTLNFAGSVNNYSRKRFLSSVPGTQRTLTITNATGVQNLDFSDIVITGITLSGTNLGNIENNSGIVFGEGRNIYMVGTTLNANSYSTTPNGAAISGLYPLAQDNLIFTDAAIVSGASVGAGAVTQTLTIKNLDFSSRTLPISFSPNANLTLNLTGDYVHSSAVTTSSGQLANYIYFIGPNDQKIISAGKLIPATRLVISKSGGQVIQNDALSVPAGSVNIWSGSLNMNGYTISAVSFRANDTTETANGLYGSSRTLNSGGGAIYITGNSENYLFTTSVVTVPTITDIFFTYTGSVGLRTFRTGSVSSGHLNLNFHILGGSDGIRLGNSTFNCRDFIIYDGWNGAITPGSNNTFRKVRIPPNRTYSTMTFQLADLNTTETVLDVNGSTIGAITATGSSTSTLQLLSNVVCGGFVVLSSFNTNNYYMRVTSFNSAISSAVRTLNLGSSIIDIVPISTTTSPISFVNSSNLTFNAGTSTINLNTTDRGATSSTIALQGQTLNILNHIGSNTGGLIFSLSGTINELNLKTTGSSSMLQIGSGVTLTVGKLTSTSRLGRRLIINSTSGTATIAKSGGGFVDLDYLDITSVIASPANTWYAGTHSTRAVTTTNWISNYRLKPKAGNFLGFF